MARDGRRDPHKGGRDAGQVLEARVLTCFEHPSGFSALLRSREIISKLASGGDAFSERAVRDCLARLVGPGRKVADQAHVFGLPLARGGSAQFQLMIRSPDSVESAPPALGRYKLPGRGTYYWIRGKLAGGWEPDLDDHIPLIPMKNAWFPAGPAKCEACNQVLGDAFPCSTVDELIRKVAETSMRHWDPDPLTGEYRNHPPAPAILPNGIHMHPPGGNEFVSWMEYAGHTYESVDEAWRLSPAPKHR